MQNLIADQEQGSGLGLSGGLEQQQAEIPERVVFHLLGIIDDNERMGEIGASDHGFETLLHPGNELHPRPLVSTPRASARILDRPFLACQALGDEHRSIAASFEIIQQGMDQRGLAGTRRSV